MAAAAAARQAQHLELYRLKTLDSVAKTWKQSKCPSTDEWIKKQDPYIFCLHETHFRRQDTYRLKVRGWKNILYVNGKQKKAGVAILISDKIDLKIKKITSDKEGHYMIIKRSIQEEDKTSVNIYAPNIGAPQYIRQTLLLLLLLSHFSHV